MRTGSRPFSLTLTSVLIIISGALSLFSAVLVSAVPAFQLDLSAHSLPWKLAAWHYVAIGLLSVIAGLAMFRGQNWGRLLYLLAAPVWLVLTWIFIGLLVVDMVNIILFRPDLQHMLTGIFIGLLAIDIVNTILYPPALWYWTRPAASNYFANRHLVPVQPVIETAANQVDQGTETLIGQATLTQATRGMPGNGAPSHLPRAWLQFKSGAGQSFPIQSPSLSIGRAPDNDLVIDDPTVSRHHARISFEGGGYSIQDLGSRSGIMVDGHTTPNATLSSGSTFRLGDTSLVFMQAESPASTRSTGAAAVLSPQTPAETMVLPSTPGLLSWLAVTAGPLQGKTYQLKSGINTIGRDSDNDVVIPDSSVSRHHAVLRVEEKRVLLADVGSSSGTSIDGRPVGGRALKVGESISMGQSRLRLMEVEAQEPQGSGTLSGDTVVVRPGSGRGGVLLVEAGPDAGKSFPVPRSGDTVVGRDNGCGLVLSDGAVSRRHCLVRGTGDGFVVYDLGSRGGTWVDGVALEGQVLPPGAVVAMGHTQLILMQR